MFNDKDPFDQAVFGSLAVFGGALALIVAWQALDEPRTNMLAEAGETTQMAAAPAPAEDTMAEDTMAEAPAEEPPEEEMAEAPAEEAPEEEVAEAPAEEAPEEEVAEAPAEEAPEEEVAEAPAEEAPEEEVAEAPAEEAPEEEMAAAPAEDVVEPVETAEAEPAAADTPFPAEQMALLNGDASAGQRVWNQCRACHVAEQEQNRVGPHLVDVLGRDIASIEGFRYSQALQDLQGQVWTPAEMDAWLEAPRDYAPGTSMGYAGLRDDEDRRNLLSYLWSLQN